MPVSACREDVGLRLIQRYRQLGAVLTCDDMIGAMREYLDQPISRLARKIVERRIVSIPWKSRTYLPAFQFEQASCDVLQTVEVILEELTPAFDDYALADWFATSNGWLHCRIPSSLVAKEPGAVLQAARADRYIATGW